MHSTGMNTPLGHRSYKSIKRTEKSSLLFGRKINGNIDTPVLLSGKRRPISNNVDKTPKPIPMKNQTLNKENEERFKADPKSTQEIFGLESNMDPLGFANVFGNEEDRKSLTPRRPSCSTPVKKERRDSIFGQPLRVKPKTPVNSKSKTPVKRGITPQRRLSSINSVHKTPNSVTRAARLSLNMNDVSQQMTPMKSRAESSFNKVKSDKKVPNSTFNFSAFCASPLSTTSDLNVSNTIKPTITIEQHSTTDYQEEKLRKSEFTTKQTIKEQLINLQEEEATLLKQLEEIQRKRAELLENLL